MPPASPVEVALGLITASLDGGADSAAIIQATIAERFAHATPLDVVRFIDDVIAHLTAIATASFINDANRMSVEPQLLLQHFAVIYTEAEAAAS